MKRAVSYILVGVVVLAVTAYLVFFLNLAAEKRHKLHCGGVKIEVADSVSRKFITAKDVEDCIMHEYGECRGMPVEEIDLTKIEAVLRAKNAVLRAEAYITTDGMLNVHVIQRVPALRFKNDEEDFYIDGDGYVFHLHTGGVEQVMIVEGHFPINVGADFQGRLSEEAGGKWVDDMLNFSKHLMARGMDDGVTIFVQENGDIVLNPTGGHPQIVFGSPDNFESKFDRLGKYYSAIVPKEGADYYSTVILKYNGQIVCRK